jgi:hypothetical protein
MVQLPMTNMTMVRDVSVTVSSDGDDDGCPAADGLDPPEAKIYHKRLMVVANESGCALKEAPVSRVGPQASKHNTGDGNHKK